MSHTSVHTDACLIRVAGYPELEKQDDGVEFISPPHGIKNKVSLGGPNAITDELLARTDRNQVINFGGMYREWLVDDLRVMEDGLKGLERGMATDAPPLVQLRDCAHELRGMGGTFDFSLVSQIGDQIYRLTANAKSVDGALIEALTVNLDALKLVAAKNLKGDGGAEGQGIMAGLQKVCAKFA